MFRTRVTSPFARGPRIHWSPASARGQECFEEEADRRGDSGSGADASRDQGMGSIGVRYEEIAIPLPHL